MGSFEAKLQTVLLYAGLNFALTIAFIALFVLTSMLCQSKAHTVAGCILLVFALLFAGIRITATLNEPEYYQAYSYTENGVTVSEDAELKAAVTNMSHDLRTPLTAICGYLDLLEREPHSGNSRRYLAVVRERTNAMCTLTQKLFRYSVITSTADELVLQPVFLNDLLEQSLSGFYGALTGRGITPEIQMPEQAVISVQHKADGYIPVCAEPYGRCAMNLLQVRRTEPLQNRQQFTPGRKASVAACGR